MEKITNIFTNFQLSKKKMLLIGTPVVILIIGIIITLIFLSNRQSNEKSTATQAPKNAFFASLTFQPTESQDPERRSYSIALDVGANSLSTIEFSIKYDPNVVSEVLLTQELDPTSALSNSIEVTENFYNEKSERNTMKLKLKADATEQNGRGIIANISFKTTPGASASILEFSDVIITSDTLGPDDEFLTQTNTIAIDQN